MFLTRLGFHSKAVITGDVTQVDLPTGKASGLTHARRLLRDVEGIAFSEFTDVDVVRHPLVQEVIRAYDRDQAERETARAAEEAAAKAALEAEQNLDTPSPTPVAPSGS
jgi:phosphate starvation-inducible PhoH-like protein